MIWSREGDIMNDKFRPLTAQRIEVGLDANNNVVAWRHRIVNESYFARIMPPDLFAKVKQDIVSGGGGYMSYAVPNHRVEWVRAARRVDVSAWRGMAVWVHQVRDRDVDRRDHGAQEHWIRSPIGSSGSRTRRALQRGWGGWPRCRTSVVSDKAERARGRLQRRASQPRGCSCRSLG